MRYLFGDFVLDCGARQLLQAGRPVPLGPKALDLLELLLRSRPAAVSRTRLTAGLWADTHVGPSSLHVLVSQLRAALRDDAGSPRWIRTVPRFGYAFAAPEDAAVPQARRPPDGEDNRPRLVFDEDEIVLEEGENVIGRDPGVAVRIHVPGVSRRHARVVVREVAATLEDLGSKNGTFVGDERVTAPRTLEHGDVVHIGLRVRCVFCCRPDTRTKTDVP